MSYEMDRFLPVMKPVCLGVEERMESMGEKAGTQAVNAQGVKKWWVKVDSEGGFGTLMIGVVTDTKPVLEKYKPVTIKGLQMGGKKDQTLFWFASEVVPAGSAAAPVAEVAGARRADEGQKAS